MSNVHFLPRQDWVDKMPPDNHLTATEVKEAIKDGVLEAEAHRHSSPWRLERVIPFTSVITVVCGLGIGLMWTQGLTDRISTLEKTASYNSARIDSMSAVFDKIAVQSSSTNERLTAVEVQLRDIVDGVRRLEEKQGDPANTH